MNMWGPADTLRELYASSRSSSSCSSNTRLFPVEMSRARKSSETICPERFCGPPQHSKEPADKGAVGLGGVFREIQVAREEQQDVKRKKRLQRGGVEEAEGHLGRGGGRRYKNRNKAQTVSKRCKVKKNPSGQTGSSPGFGGVGGGATAAQHVRQTQRESKQREQQRPLVDRKRRSTSLNSMLTGQNQETISSR